VLKAVVKIHAMKVNKAEWLSEWVLEEREKKKKKILASYFKSRIYRE
jgi:hypothetical protein